MRAHRPTTTTVLLALLAATACAVWSAAPTVSALADTSAATGGATATGGSGAAGGSSAAGKDRPVRAKVHRTSIDKTSIATWFGPGFYGQQTACGQTLTPAVVGVANRTLPCGTLVQVSYRGRALTVPVLDRGPYANHADWDLTAGAAEALAITATVRIGTRVVGSVPNTPSLGAPLVTAAAAATGGAQAGLTHPSR